jgi:hypothetical protein
MDTSVHSEIAVSMFFDDYFMFMPNGRNSSDKTYWVTLARGGYNWGAGATYEPPSTICVNGTGTCINSSPAKNASATSPYDDYTDLPTYSGQFINSTSSTKRRLTTRPSEERWTTPIIWR